jgi:GT2 family glycosyltransferase
MDLSILIVNWNTRDRLEECLQSIRDTASGLSHEVVVVDNASADGSAAMVRQGFPEYSLIESRENLGFARGNNLAFSRSSGKYLLVLNPDVVVHRDTLEGLVEFAAAHPDAGLISPRLLHQDGTAQKKYYGRIPTLSTVFFLYTRPGAFLDARFFGNRFRRRDRYEDLEDFEEPIAFTDGGAAFCCTLVPRRIIDDIGFFDERFPVFFNDGDFAMRVFRAGYRAYLLPQVEAVHAGGASVQQLDVLTYGKEFAYGLRAFCRKHRGRIYAAAVDALLGLDALAEVERTARECLAGSKGVAEVLRPITRFREKLKYRPPNAAPTPAGPSRSWPTSRAGSRSG